MEVGSAGQGEKEIWLSCSQRKLGYNCLSFSSGLVGPKPTKGIKISLNAFCILDFLPFYPP